MHFERFQSTRPSRASTSWFCVCGVSIIISIHKALTGLDGEQLQRDSGNIYFNPQGPHGPRPGGLYRMYRKCAFQSTRPSRASTKKFAEDFKNWNISIHKALTGLDSRSRGSGRRSQYFNPQGPHGPRLPNGVCYGSGQGISIHKALTGLDWIISQAVFFFFFFLSPPPPGARPRDFSGVFPTELF